MFSTCLSSLTQLVKECPLYDEVPASPRLSDSLHASHEFHMPFPDRYRIDSRRNRENAKTYDDLNLPGRYLMTACIRTDCGA